MQTITELAARCPPRCFSGQPPTDRYLYLALHNFVGFLLHAGQVADEAALDVWLDVHRFARVDPDAAADVLTEINGKASNSWASILRVRDLPRSAAALAMFPRSPARAALMDVCRHLEHVHLDRIKTAKHPPAGWTLAHRTAAAIMDCWQPSGEPDHKAGGRAVKRLVSVGIIRVAANGTADGKQPGTAAMYRYCHVDQF